MKFTILAWICGLITGFVIGGNEQKEVALLALITLVAIGVMTWIGVHQL